jgi:hypothetical protein
MLVMLCFAALNSKQSVVAAKEPAKDVATNPSADIAKGVAKESST